jgi:hypothetical protein
MAEDIRRDTITQQRKRLLSSAGPLPNYRSKRKSLPSHYQRVILYSSGIQPFLFAYPQEVISLQSCTPEFVGV